MYSARWAIKINMDTVSSKHFVQHDDTLMCLWRRAHSSNAEVDRSLTRGCDGKETRSACRGSSWMKRGNWHNLCHFSDDLGYGFSLGNANRSCEGVYIGIVQKEHSSFVNAPGKITRKRKEKHQSRDINAAEKKRKKKACKRSSNPPKPSRMPRGEIPSPKIPSGDDTNLRHHGHLRRVRPDGELHFDAADGVRVGVHGRGGGGGGGGRCVAWPVGGRERDKEWGRILDYLEKRNGLWFMIRAVCSSFSLLSETK